jgi:hypothetical protein
VLIPYGVWDTSANPDTVKATPGVWDLDGPLHVVAANATLFVERGESFVEPVRDLRKIEIH